MIRIERERLKFLLAGRAVTVELARQPAKPYRSTRTYAVALPGKRSATCRVHVLDVDGLVLRIRHAPDAQDRPRMLRRGFGYQAIGDPLDAGEVPPDEPRRRLDQLRSTEQTRTRLRSLAIRFRAAARDQDFEAIGQIRREIEEVERNAA